MEYRDGLGHMYNVPEKDVPAFEANRTVMLIAKIIIQLTVLFAMGYGIYLNNLPK